MAETLERVTAPTKPSTPRSVFIFRFGSTLVLWSIALGIIFSGYEIAFFLLIGTLGLLSLWEFYGMLDHKGLPNFKVTAMICGTVMLVGSFYYFSRMGPGHSYDFEVAVLLFFLLTVFTRQMFDSLRDDAPLRTMAYTIFGLLYVLWLYNFITKIVYVVPRSPTGAVMGQFYVLYLIAVTKFSDMGAYLTGSLIGRHQMIPHISPKKTWEGFFGALAFSLLASWGLWKLMPGHLPGMSLTHSIVLGLLLGFSAVIGDLAESMWKRSAAVKDSGTLLPGHGGFLDRFDSIFYTTPILYVYWHLILHNFKSFNIMSA